MSKRWTKTKHEIVELIPPTIFFFCAFHFIAFVRVLMLKGTGIELQTSVSVTIAALVVAKSVALADLLPAINRYPNRPLAYNVAWKSAIYFVAAGIIHYLERLVEFWRQAGILNYCVIRELNRTLGEHTLRRMFFGPVPAMPVASGGL